MKTKTKPARKIPAVDSTIEVPGSSTTVPPVTSPKLDDPVRPASPDTPSAAEAGPGRGGAREGAGRPPNRPKPIPQIPQFTKQGLARLWQMLFGIVAVRRGEHWEIDDVEAGNLAESTDAVLKQYLPLLEEHAALVCLGISLALTMSPRIMLDRHAAKTPDRDDVAVQVDDKPAGRPVRRPGRPKSKPSK